MEAQMASKAVAWICSALSWKRYWTMGSARRVCRIGVVVARRNAAREWTRGCRVL